MLEGVDVFEDCVNQGSRNQVRDHHHLDGRFDGSGEIEGCPVSKQGTLGESGYA